MTATEVAVATVAPLRFRVVGKPAPQGSKNGMPTKNGKVRMVESSDKTLRPWRQDVRAAAIAALEAHPGWPPGGPRTGYRSLFEVVLYRPQNVPKAHPGWTNKGIDWDKAGRAINDALTEAGVWPDDRCVFDGRVTKRLALPGEPMGCHITIEQVTW
jgi:hypothetical protein